MAVALGHSVLLSGLTIWASRLSDFGQMSGGDIVARLLHVAFPSNAAVGVFFVLSGHVLWRSLARKVTGLRDLPEYLLARSLRLHPVAIVTTLMFASLGGIYIAAPSPEVVWRSMLLFDPSLNGVLWSLQVEAICSVLLFFLWVCSGGSKWRIVLLIGLFLLARRLDLPFWAMLAVLHAPTFLLGALIDAAPERLKSYRSLWLGLLVLVGARLLFGNTALSATVEGVAAYAVVAAIKALQPPVLLGSLSQFLGRISYPFYLLHPVMGAVVGSYLYLAGQSNRFANMALFAATSIPLALVLALVIHKLVEAPMMRLASRLRAPSSRATGAFSRD